MNDPAYFPAAPAPMVQESHTFTHRLFLLAVLLAAELTVLSVLVDGQSLAGKAGLVGVLRDWGSGSLRFLVGFAALFVTFGYSRVRPALPALSAELDGEPLRASYFAIHAVLITAFGFLSSALYGSTRLGWSDGLLTGVWIATGAAAIPLAALTFIPWRVWREALRPTGNLWIYALGAATAAGLLVNASRAFWEPTTRLTLRLVTALLTPFIPEMVIDPTTQMIKTAHFRVFISPECSGLEGAGLILVFGCAFLWLFRAELRFPQALVLLPAGIVTLYMLNAVRVAALVLIGHAGARQIAAGGFHSQAGWIAFNGVAFGLTLAARRWNWISNATHQSARAAAPADPATTAYLLPFLAILAVGMLTRAVSGTFEWFYPARFIAAAAALWWFREQYRRESWRFSWAGVAAGVVVFLLWAGMDRLSSGGQPATIPAALAAASPATRAMWIAIRVLAASLTVPIAEELAFRGYLLRRFVAPTFTHVTYARVSLFAVAASSIAFGLLHGGRWIEGSIAGALFAAAAWRTDRIGDAVVAHSIANLLLAGYVLTFHQWQLW